MCLVGRYKPVFLSFGFLKILGFVPFARTKNGQVNPDHFSCLGEGTRGFSTPTALRSPLSGAWKVLRTFVSHTHLHNACTTKIQNPGKRTRFPLCKFFGGSSK